MTTEHVNGNDPNNPAPPQVPEHIAALKAAGQAFEKAQMEAISLKGGNVNALRIALSLSLLQAQFDVVVTMLVETNNLDHKTFCERVTNVLNAKTAMMQAKRIQIATGPIVSKGG